MARLWPSLGVHGENAVAKTTSTKKTAKKRKRKKSAVAAPPLNGRNQSLGALTDDALRGYLATLNGHRPADLYKLVIGEVEKPLFRAILDYADGNQSEAAEILGINRGTLRKKLIAYKLLDA
jgi:Fis family transcriptional regulator, factor for inversion stimulation protein